MSTLSVISVEGLGKKYPLRSRTARKGYRTLRDAVASGVRNILRPGTHEDESGCTEEFWALRDISFELRQGEVLGIIGRNGAGKSTLLKILSRITPPTAGRVRLQGRVASLLEVGTGFHPELSGRENIHLNGAILGMSRTEIRAKFDEITQFAGVERFLDTPVKQYSSGMRVRLAFAVAAHLDPEILIIDEVLAVGDAGFQKRCLGRINEISRGGRTVLLVSHQLNVISTLCGRCLTLAEGRLVNDGPPAKVISEYLDTPSTIASEWTRNVSSGLEDPCFTAQRFALVDANLKVLGDAVVAGAKIGVLVEGEILTVNPLLTLGFAIYAECGTLLWWSLQTDTAEKRWPELKQGVNRLICWLPANLLNEGRYRIELIVSIHWTKWISQPGANAPSTTLQVRGGLSESPYWAEARPGLLAPVLTFQSI